MSSHKLVYGFTLLELLISLSLLTILALVAVPSYQQRIRASNQDLAAQVVLQDAQFLEKWYGQCGSYVSDGLGHCGTSQWPRLPYRQAPEQGKPLYLISFSAQSAEANSYRLLATPICGTGQANLGCICVDQDSNVTLATNRSCNNSPALCSCTKLTADTRQ